MFSLAQGQTSTSAQFSDLLGMGKKPEGNKKDIEKSLESFKEEVRQSQKENEPKKKSEVPEVKSRGFTPDYSNGIRLMFGGLQPKPSDYGRRSLSEPVLFKRPTLKSLGFDIPMTFFQNFKDNVDWKAFVPNPIEEEADKRRVKRSTLDESHFRNAMIAAILQRQLLMAEDHRVAHAEPVIHGAPPPILNHHVSSIHVPSPLAAPDAFAIASHPVPAPPVLANLPHPNSVHKGYDPPIKGGSLEEVFGVASKYLSPAKPGYAPEPVYNAPVPAYTPPVPAYSPPVPAYNPPAPAYSPPAPDYVAPNPAYVEPPPAYTPPAAVYNPPLPAYNTPPLVPAYTPPVPEPAYVAPPIPVPAYVAPPVPEPAYVAPPEPRYVVTPEPRYVVTPEPIYHPGPKYVPPEPVVVIEPKPSYVEPKPAYVEPKPLGSYKPPSFKGHPFSMEMVFGLPMHNYYMTKYSHLLPNSFHGPERVYDAPVPAPVYQVPIPTYKEPLPLPHPEPAYVAPPLVVKKPGYDLPSHGGSLEDVFGLSTQYGKPSYAPPVPPPDYAPPSYTPEFGHPSHNSYTLHYLPFEDYVPVHPEALAVKAKIPTLPGAAHILVQSPHPHIGDLPAPPPRLILPDPHLGLKHIRKRFAEGQSNLSLTSLHDFLSFPFNTPNYPSFTVQPAELSHVDHLSLDTENEESKPRKKRSPDPLRTSEFRKRHFRSDDDSELEDYEDEEDPTEAEGALDERSSFRLPSIKFKKVKLSSLFRGKPSGNKNNSKGKGKTKNKTKGKTKGKKNKNKTKNRGNPSGSNNYGQQQQQQQQHFSQNVPSSGNHGLEAVGTSTNSLPICTEATRSSGPWNPCFLKANQANGVGGIVIRPPSSHPIVQIHVGENTRLPDLAFYPANSPLDKGISSPSVSNQQNFVSAPQPSLASTFQANPNSFNSAGNTVSNNFDATQNAFTVSGSYSIGQGNLQAPVNNNQQSNYQGIQNFQAQSFLQGTTIPTQPNINNYQSAISDSQQSTYQSSPISQGYQAPSLQTFPPAPTFPSTNSPGVQVLYPSSPAQDDYDDYDDSLPDYNANSYRLKKHAPDSVPSRVIVFPDAAVSQPLRFPLHPGLVTQDQGKTLIEQQQEALVLQEPRNAHLTNSQTSLSQPGFVQQNPFLTHNANQGQGLNVIPSPNNLQSGTNQIPNPLRPAAATPTTTAKNPFLNQNGFGSGEESETTTFGSSPNVGFQPFRPPSWYFNDTDLMPELITADDFHPSPQVLLGTISTSENPIFIPQQSTSFFENLASMSSKNNDGLSPAPVANMSRSQIVELFKIREGALQAIINEMLEEKLRDEATLAIEAASTTTTSAPKSKSNSATKIIRLKVDPEKAEELRKGPAISESDLQELLHELNREQFLPSKVEKTTEKSASTLKPPPNVDESLFEDFDVDVSEFKTPKNGPWDKLKDTPADSEEFNLPPSGGWKGKSPSNASKSGRLKLKTTELQELFRTIDPKSNGNRPAEEWDFSAVPKEIRVKTTELQDLLEAVDPASFKNPQERWHFERMVNTDQSGIVVLRKTEFQQLFEAVGKQEFSTPKSGVWQVTTVVPVSTENTLKLDEAMTNVQKLKEQVSEMIRLQEDKIDKKGFMTTKEKEIMQALKEKEEKLIHIVDQIEEKQELSRGPKFLGSNSKPGKIIEKLFGNVKLLNHVAWRIVA